MALKEAINNINNENKEVVVIPEEVKAILTNLAESEKQYKSLGEKRDKFKKDLLEAMEQYKIDKWENEDFVVQYVKPSTRNTVNTKVLKDLYPNIYNEVKNSSNVKASIRFKVK
ncbi:MAG: hypothetical protein ACRDBY_14225 [Cetobacterium sp.]